MKYLCQRAGRHGWYVRYPVPSAYRARLGRACIERKAGSTLNEAKRTMHGIIHAIQEELLVRFGEADEITTWRRQFGAPSEITIDEKEILIGSLDLDDKNVRNKLELYLENARTWQELLAERLLVEQPRKTTERGWRGHLQRLHEWLKHDYPCNVTKRNATDYRIHLLERMSRTSARAVIASLKGMWSFGITNGFVKDNPWQGLTANMNSTVKHQLPSVDVFNQALTKAINGQDLRFLIMYYTGCRKSEASGLRGCDIDMDNQSIRFVQWEQDGMVRGLKGHGKDERAVPIHSKLMEQLTNVCPNVETCVLWPNSYKPSDQSWGAGWAGSFKEKYGFVSHDLRRRAVTVMMNAGVSPFVLNEITRHKVPGMSSVVQLYVRPTLDEIRSTIELL